MGTRTCLPCVFVLATAGWGHGAAKIMGIEDFKANGLLELGAETLRQGSDVDILFLRFIGLRCAESTGSQLW